MTKRIAKSAASIALFGATAFAALNAVLNMDVTNVCMLAATAFSVGMIHEALWG